MNSLAAVMTVALTLRPCAATTGNGGPWISMFNEHMPTDYMLKAWANQSAFANVYFHGNVSALVEAHRKYGGQGFLSIQHSGIWSIPKALWHNQNETGLQPDWHQTLSRILSNAAPLLTSGELSGFFLGDELATRGVPVENVTNVAAAIKSHLRALNNTPSLVYLNEGSGPFDPAHTMYLGTWVGKPLPQTIDVISLDIYCDSYSPLSPTRPRVERKFTLDAPLEMDHSAIPACKQPEDEPRQARAFIEKNLVPLLESPGSQRLLAVPGLFMDWNTSRSGLLEQQERQVLKKLEAYVEWIKEDKRLLGLNNWHWTTSTVTPPPSDIVPFYYGVDHMPRVQARLVQVAGMRRTRLHPLPRLPVVPGEAANFLAAGERLQ